MTLVLNDPSPGAQPDDRSAVTGSLLDSLIIVARFRTVHLSKEQVIRDHQITGDDVSLTEALRIAYAAGLRARATTLRWGDLFKMGEALPAIVQLRNGGAMVLMRAEAHMPGWPPVVVLRDPNGNEEAPLLLDEERFNAVWDGEVILIKRDYRLRDEDRPFGVGWIVGQLLHDRRVSGDLAICAILMGILALGPVMFWRVMVDRVMYYGSMNTFTMICVAFGVLLIFETTFGHLRRYLIAFVSARVDAKAWTFIFNKVLNLPIEYFERTPTGVILHDVYEFQRIRGFLTGQVFGTVLDSFVLVVFLPIMFMFSAIMTACVLAICLLMCLWLIVMLPTIRRKVGAAIAAETERGTHLVEAIHGIRAIKSLALDARQRHQWDVLVAKVVETRFDEGCTSNIVQTVVHPLQVLMTSGVIAIAVYLALVNHDMMYLGAIFAFMIMTQRVTMPIVQAAQAIVQIDEARSAIARVQHDRQLCSRSRADPAMASGHRLLAGSNSTK